VGAAMIVVCPSTVNQPVGFLQALLWIIEAWPQLNESTKADMIAMVRTVES